MPRGLAGSGKQAPASSALTGLRAGTPVTPTGGQGSGRGPATHLGHSSVQWPKPAINFSEPTRLLASRQTFLETGQSPDRQNGHDCGHSPAPV